MRILVIGDPYCPSRALRGAFATAGRRALRDVRGRRRRTGLGPVDGSERRIREATGSPEQVLALLDHHDVLVVQAAPVTEGVLEAAPSVRLVCCVRGGPVNVDVAAATARGVPVATTPGKNADAVAELTIAFVIMLARRLAGGRPLRRSWGRDRPRQLRGWQLVRPRRRAATRWGSSATGRSAGASPSVPGRSGCGSWPTIRSWSRPCCGPTRSSPSTCRPSCRIGLRLAPRPRHRHEPRAHRRGRDRRDEAGRLPHQHRPRLAARRGGGRSRPWRPARSPAWRSTWPARRRRPVGIRCSDIRTWSSRPTSAARPTRRWPTAREMAVDEIERFAAGRRARATSPILPSVTGSRVSA